MNYNVREDFDCQMLYFTSSSCLRNNNGIVFIGEKNENPNVYWKEFSTGKVTKISQNNDGIMKSYVYFNGEINKGLAKASVCLDNHNEQVYYLQGRDICKADLDGNITVLAQIPEDQVTAFMHVSGDGTRLCVPTTDMRALEAPRIEGRATRFNMNNRKEIDERVQKEFLNSYLRVYDTKTGEEILCERVPRAWITHVQFHPKDNNIIMYNHEWPSNCGIRRMWLWNGEYHKALRTIDEGRGINDWVCHEMWSDDGESVIYHGSHDKSGDYFVGRIDMVTGKITEIELPKEYRKYGHFTISCDGLLVSDGYYQTEKENSDSSAGNQAKWISVQKVNWDAGTIDWYPIEEHNSSWGNQDYHPHPIFSPDGNRVYYTSDKIGKTEEHNGKLEIYSCEVPAEALR